MRARLTAEAGECEPVILDCVPGHTTTIGRNRESSIVVRDELVSRLHAKIYFEDGKWFLRDFGLNGTRVNNQKVSNVAVLTENSEIVIGTATFRFSMGTASNLTGMPVTSHKVGDTPPPVEKRSSSPQENRGTRPIRNTPRVSALESSPVSPNGEVLRSLTPDSETELTVRELEVLRQFTLQAISLADPKEMLTLTLTTILEQTRANLVGYLNLDPSDPTPKMVLPERAAVDAALSRKMTESVKGGHAYWLFGGDHQSGANNPSLNKFTDAVCVPLIGANKEPVAAIHAYRTGQPFTKLDFNLIRACVSFLSPALERMRNQRKLNADNQRLRSALPAAEEIIGDSSAMMAVRQQIGRAAPLPFTVLISGESGVGKELVALALHRGSPRADGPLIVVNCATMTPVMLEAELFGYRKGAFSGADDDYAGLFEQADDGTLFLDEVADLPMDCQAKLLRVIENKPFRPLGGSHDIQVDVRVVAATNRDLEAEVKAGRFRQDLLFRLKVITIRVPALREHPEDIIELARFFLQRLSSHCHKSFRLSSDAEHLLMSYNWPGNVRQLRAVLESAAVMAEGELIDADLLPIHLPTEPAPSPVVPQSSDTPNSLLIDDLETWAILKALKQTSGNVSQAARVLGISRDTLHTKLKKKNIDRDAAVSRVASTETVS